MRLKYSCKFPNCKSGYYQLSDTDGAYKNKKFYRFPRPSKRETLDKWKEACNIKEDKNCYSAFVCEDHFLPVDFVNETGHRINYQAVPKNISRLSDDKINILSDHAYIKYFNTVEGTENKACDVRDKVTDDAEPCNLTTQSDDIYNTDDEDFTHSYAQIKFNNTLNINSASNGNTNYSDLAFLHYDKYEFLLSPFQCSDENVSDGTTPKVVLWDGESVLPFRLNTITIHTNIMKKLERLNNLISEEEEPYIKILLTLCKKGIFKLLLKYMGWLSDPFVNARFKSLNYNSNDEWNVQDTIIALYLYKHGSRFYQYLLSFFNLPVMNHLERIYINIQFNTGLDPSLMTTLKSVASNIDHMDTYCYLAFDKMALTEELVYDGTKQLIYGYQDMGRSGRSHIVAKYALVFMVCGLKKPWKQIVGYYFVGHAISNELLKHCIRETISQLQAINFNVVATICNYSLFGAVLNELCKENVVEQDPVYFLANKKPIMTMYNVEQLLKDTRETFLYHNIILDNTFTAEFEYVKESFDIDAKKRFQSLPKLKREDFTGIECDIAAAKAQLSNAVAASIETLVMTRILPADAINTADFISIISDLYESLSSDNSNFNGNRYGSILDENSSHVGFWSNITNVMDKWKVVDAKTGVDNTDSVAGFLKGWQITIKSVLLLWSFLKKEGFTNLNLKLLDQEPLKDLFLYIKNYNTGFKEKPTCFQFVNVLKQSIIEDCLFLSKDVHNQYKDPFPLCNLAYLWIEHADGREVSQNKEDINRSDINEKLIVDSIINSSEIKEIMTCETCKRSLFSHNLARTLFVSMYAINDSFIAYLGTISDKLYKCLGRYSYKDQIEDRFKKVFLENNTTKFCDQHSLEIFILNKAVPLLIYRFVIEFNQSLQIVSKRYSLALRRGGRPASVAPSVNPLIAMRCNSSTDDATLTTQPQCDGTNKS